MAPTRQIDVRGLSCPEPVLRVGDALRALGTGRLEVLLDPGTAHDNIVRIAERAGWRVTGHDEGDGLRVMLEK